MAATPSVKSGKGQSHGVISELAAFYHVKPGHADALREAIKGFRFESRHYTLRAKVAVKLGLDIFSEAKKAGVPNSEVRHRAAQRWPLWVG
jgi:hypothetical protein